MTNPTVTVEEALNEIRAQEYAAQITSLTERLAVERVRNLQLEQEVKNLRNELAASSVEAGDDEKASQPDA